MRRLALATGIVIAAAALSCPAGAQQAAPPSASAAPAATTPAATTPAATTPAATTPAPPPAAATPAPPSVSPAAAASGVAVVALVGATDAAWPLARSVYGSPSLRPASIDEVHARTLCGEAPAAGAPQELRDLAESVTAVKGDDAPSRAILGEIARRTHVKAIVVVRVDGGQASARAFVADAGSFDAASYAPDAGAGTVAWSGAVQSLSRAFGVEPPAPPTPMTAPALATHEEPVVAGPPPHRKAFYESAWFWGALGAAAFAGGAIFFATRDNGDPTIHLQAEVPH